ncbi:hypothetical protein II906_11500 [bacterium]|nr:hypothetical protein [bacterium]
MEINTTLNKVEKRNINNEKQNAKRIDGNLAMPVSQKKDEVSFKGVAQIAQTLTSDNKIGKFFRALEFDGGNMTFPMLATAMFIGTLVPRIKNAKDKYDREEIIRRDVTSCCVLLAGEKIMRKGFSKLNENKSGLVLANKPDKFDAMTKLGKVWQYIRPVKGVRILSSGEIRGRYHITQTPNGVENFCNFISENGGSLAKVFGMSTKGMDAKAAGKVKEAASIVKKLLPEGQELKDATNETITTALKDAKDSEAIKQLTSLFEAPKTVAKTSGILSKIPLINKLAPKTEEVLNPWANKAKTLNDRFTAFSVLLLVPILLGFALPFINEHTTKKKVKEENDLNKTNSVNSNNLKYFQPDKKTQEIFKGFYNN